MDKAPIKELKHLKKTGKFIERHYLNSDNTITAIITPISNFFIDKRWRKYNGHVISKEGKSKNQNFYFDSINYSAIFPAKLPGRISINVDNKKISIKPVKILNTDGVLIDDDIGVKYENAWQETDLIYKTELDEIKEYIVIKGPTAPRSFSFNIIGPGDPCNVEFKDTEAHDLKGNPISIIEEKRQYISEINVSGIKMPRPFAFDAKGTQVGLTCDFDDDTQVVSITWHGSEEEIVFPITIDPTTVTTPSTRVYNGDVTQVTVPSEATGIVSAKIRWTKASKVVTVEKQVTNIDGYKSGSTSVTVPSVPSGETGKSSSQFHGSQNKDDTTETITLNWSGPFSTGSESRSVSGGSYFAKSFSGSYSPGSSVSTSASTTGSSVYTYARADSYYDDSTTVYTTNPNAKVGENGLWVNPIDYNGNSSPSTTQDSQLGQLSVTTTPWYDLPGFNLGTNDIYHYSYNAAGQYYEIEYTYESNVAPEPPTLDTKQNFDATEDAEFTWSFNDPDENDYQTAYQLQIIRVSDSTIIVDTGKVVSAESSYILTANTLSNHEQYQWKVKTWDSSDLESSYSDLSTFYTSSRPVVEITHPANDYDEIPTSELEIQWTYSDQANEQQSAYQVVLMDQNGENVLYDSDKVFDGNARSHLLDYFLENNTYYQIRLKVWDDKNVVSDEAVRIISVVYTPPAIPGISINHEEGFVRIVVTNPEPEGTEPNVSVNSIYCRKAGESNWTRIATGIPANGSYDDYAVASGQEYEYKVRAHGDNKTTTDSATANATITLDGIWIHSVLDPGGTAINVIPNKDIRVTWKPERELRRYDGRSKPVVEYGEHSEKTYEVTLTTIKDESVFSQLESLIYSKETLCIRDYRGRKIFGTPQEFPEVQLHFGSEIPLLIDEIDYTEEV